MGGLVHATDGGFGAGDGGVGVGEACGVGTTAVGVGVGEGDGEGEAAARMRGPFAVQADPTDRSTIPSASQACRAIHSPNAFSGVSLPLDAVQSARAVTPRRSSRAVIAAT